MEILFYIPYDHNSHTRWDGETIRTGGAGVSGSHQSMVLVAEWLAMTNDRWSVYIYNYCPNKEYNKVKYIDNLEAAYNVSTVIVPSFAYSLAFLNKFPKLQRVIIWYHCHFVLQMHDLPRHLIVDAVHLSDWSQRQVLSNSPDHRIRHHYQIPNALMTDVLPPYNTAYRPPDAIFTPCYERGGLVAERVWSLLKHQHPDIWGQIIIKNYTSQEAQYDKRSLYALQSNVRYFIYPLVLPTYCVHRDTFGCCVAEAIASGVEVISYPIGALPQHYGDMIHYIPLPNGLTPEFINSGYFINVPELFADAQVKVIADFLCSLHATYDQRRKQREINAQIVKQRFNIKNIGPSWTHLILNS